MSQPMDKMERVRAALEHAVAEQWDAEQRSDAVRDDALRDATAAPRHMKLAEVARLVMQPALEKDAARAPPAPVDTNNAARIRTIHVDTNTLTKQRVVAAINGSAEREAFCVLHAVVAERLDERGVTTLGVTGPSGSTGKTLTAVNLAIGLAKDMRRKVVLVDLNLREPAVHTRFDFAATAGVEACLFEGVALTDALFCPSVDGLAVLPARGGSRNVAQVLSSANLARMLEELKRLRPGSTVILDLPSIGSHGSGLEQLVDALLIVVEDGVTTEREFRRVATAMSPSKILGVVLNKAEAHA